MVAMYGDQTSDNRTEPLLETLRPDHTIMLWATSSYTAL